MSVKIISTHERVSAFLEGEIDHHSAIAIRENIDDAIREYRPRLLKIDYSDVTFMDSSGIGLIMGRYRIINSYKGQLTVTGLSPQLYKVVQLAGLEKIAKIQKREDFSNENN